MKKYYYVQVITGNKIKFVTSLDYNIRDAHWDKDKKPLNFKKRTSAYDIALGLSLNGYYAFVVESIYELNFTNGDLK